MKRPLENPFKFQLLLLAVIMLLLILPAILEAAQTTGLKPGQQIAVNQITKQISTIEWLAPLAPVALSPFFGICLLAGLACYGPDWLPDNALLGEFSPFANPLIFWAFLVLTILTSVPRLSKVSKPVAQFADFLETYSVVIILGAMKILSSLPQSDPNETAMIFQAGFIDVGWDGLIAICMGVNIIVINAVKFFFEFLVWVTPVPMLDAAFEVANKALCASLMAVYAFNPVIALVINLLLFAACLYVFKWARRRELFFRSTLTDFVLGKFNKNRGATIPSALTVFPAYDVGKIKRRSKSQLLRVDGKLRLTHKRLLRTPLVESLADRVVIEKGWWTNNIVLDDGTKLTFTSRFNKNLDELASHLGGTVHETVTQVSDEKYAKQIEFN